MKKIILLLACFFAAFAGEAQLATAAYQVTQIVKEDTANARLSRVLTGQTAQTASLTVIRKGIDTLNQSARVEIALQTANNATAVAVKKGTDTLNQNSRVIITRLNTLAEQLEALQMATDSINQGTKIKSITCAITSTNTGTTYSVGYAINGATAVNSVAIGAGNWQIIGAIMYPTVASSTLDVNLSVFNASVTGGADNTAYASSTTINNRYAGVLHFTGVVPFGQPIYTARAATGTSIGDGVVNITGNPGYIWFVLTANTAFTPPNGEAYNFRIFLKKLN